MQTQVLSIEELPITKSALKGDCLYLHCQGDRPREILSSFANGSSSTMLSEGVRLMKLHGKTWALGIELPTSEAALLAAEIVEHLVAHPQTRGVAFKVLLKQNSLHVLCEMTQAISRTVIALPILQALRATQPSEYLQAAIVTGRVRGQKSHLWTFDVDLQVVGIDDRQDDHQDDRQDDCQDDRRDDAQSKTEPVLFEPLRSFPLLPVLKQLGQHTLQGRWLVTTAPTFSRRVAVGCGIGLLLGIGAMFWLDRRLSQYVRQTASGTAIAAAPIQEPPQRTRPTFNNALLNQKMAVLDWFFEVRRQQPDVLIVGSSRALRGIDPTTLEETLSRRGYRGIQVFNFGLNGATAKVVNLQLARILRKEQLPKLVIWADGVRALNSNRDDLTFKELAASPGFAEVVNRFGESDELPRSAAKPPTPLALLFERLMTAYPQRLQLRDALVKDYDRATQGLSNSGAIVAANLPNLSMEMDTKGFIKVAVTFDPETYFRVYPSVPGDYDLDYRDFDIEGEQMNAFNALSNFCQHHSIQLVFVNLPMHGSYLDRARLEYESVFNNRMRQLSDRWNFTYIDLGQIWRDRPQYFSDPSHLNYNGAIALSRKLAGDPKIPWYQAVR